MKSSVSPQTRFVLLVALVALAGIGVAVLSLGRAQRAAEETAAPNAAVERMTPPARATAKPNSRPQIPRPRVNPIVASALRLGLPPVVATALASRQVVVVELFSPESDIDRLALDEATAGARAAGAGLVALDVSREADKPTRALATKFSVLSAPTLLVFKRPGTLAFRINGFADSETVAQAARNAAP